MAKSATKKSNVDTGKSPAAFNEKNSPTASQSTINPSRYAPGSDSDVNVQALDPEDGLLKLFTDAVKDIYWAENQLVKALPKMANAAGTLLKKAIRTTWRKPKFMLKGWKRFLRYWTKNHRPRNVMLWKVLQKKAKPLSKIPIRVHLPVTLGLSWLRRKWNIMKLQPILA